MLSYLVKMGCKFSWFVSSLKILTLTRKNWKTYVTRNGIPQYVLSVYCNLKSVSFLSKNEQSSRSYFVHSHLFLSGSKWYECTTKDGNSYENKNSFISTKSIRIFSIKWFFVASFTSTGICDVMNTQNKEQ